MKISVQAQVLSARRNLKQYQKKHLPAAITRSLNRTLTGTVVDTKELMSKRINLTKRVIGGKIKKTFASAKPGYNRYVAIMRVDEDKKPNIASFKGTKQLKRAGVVEEGGKRPGRLPIKPIFGDSVSGLFTQRPKQGRSIKKMLRPKIRGRFGVELGRQLARIK
jgi:hypothetical protein